MATDLLEAKGSDALGRSSDRDQEVKFQSECHQVRRSIRSMLSSATQGNTLLKEKDVQDYMDGISDNALRLGGAKTYQKQLEWLKDHESNYVPKMIKQARHYQSLYQDAMSAAKSSGGLNARNAEHFERVLTRRSGSWAEVKAFFEKGEHEQNSFLHWVKNWKEIGEKLRKVESLRQEVRGARLLPEVVMLHTSEFTQGKVVKRIQMLDKALFVLTRYQHGNGDPYKKAKILLQKAVDKGGMTQAKVEGHLTRIFDQYKGEAAINYIQNVLPGRVDDWIKEGGSYRDLAKKCHEAGVPYPKEEEFFALSYPQRRSKLMQMQSALNGGEGPHPMLEQVQTLLDKDDLEAANKLANKTSKMPLTTMQRRRLFDLHQQIRMDMNTSKGKSTNLDAEKKVHEKRGELVKTMKELHPDLYEYYGWPLREGGPNKWDYLQRLRVWHFNIKWARDRGFIPNESTYRKMKDASESDTKRILQQEGHRSRGVEMLHLGRTHDRKENMQRPFDGGKSRGPTYYFYNPKDPTSMENLQTVVRRNRGSYEENYWGLSGSIDATLEQTVDGFEKINPILKSLRSAEDEAGCRDDSISLGGSKDSSSKHADAEAQFTMAA